MECQPKLNEKKLWGFYISSFKVLFIGIYKKQPPVLLLILFWISFKGADTNFHNFLELHLGLSEKKFSLKFSSFNRFSQTPLPHNSQSLLIKTNFFCWCSFSTCLYLFKKPFFVTVHFSPFSTEENSGKKLWISTNRDKWYVLHSWYNDFF